MNTWTEDLMRASNSLWMQPRFGYTPESAALKMSHEAAEVMDDPNSIKEKADVLITLFGSLAASGQSWQDLLNAAANKIAVNNGRGWRQKPDGTWQHTGGTTALRVKVESTPSEDMHAALQQLKMAAERSLKVTVTPEVHDVDFGTEVCTKCGSHIWYNRHQRGCSKCDELVDPAERDD